MKKKRKIGKLIAAGRAAAAEIKQEEYRTACSQYRPIPGLSLIERGWSAALGAHACAGSVHFRGNDRCTGWLIQQPGLRVNGIS